MARPYRLQKENCFYHITSRGDDRKKIFISERDYEKFLEYLQTAKDKFKFYLYAYCLMPNHYHLLLETTQANISKIMHYINGSYTGYYNIKRDRCGHIFQGRYKSLVVEKDSYFQELSRYIHLNPVRSRMVETPGKYQWSSYNGYLEKKDLLLDREKIQQCLGMNKEQYHQFVYEGIKEVIDPFKNVYAGFLLGSISFIKDKLKSVEDQIIGEEIAHKQELASTGRKEDIIKAVTGYYKKNFDEIKKSKSRPMKDKQVLIYLLRKYTGLTNKEIGEEFAMKFAAVSKAATRIEKLVNMDEGLADEIKEIMSSFEV